MIIISTFEGLEEIKLEKPCQLLKSNEKTKNCAQKLTGFYYRHKLSWATTIFHCT